MTAFASIPKLAGRPTSPTGEPVELARYTTPSVGERVIRGQRVDGRVRLTDHPAAGGARAFVIERGLEQDGNAAMLALIDDYKAQAVRHDEVPMRSSAVQRYLDHLE
jgi:hypothetical protein